MSRTNNWGHVKAMVFSQHGDGCLSPLVRRWILVSLLALFSACFLLLTASHSSAVTTVPTKMNFQGRLTDSSGNIKPNGTYNMRLKLYTVSSGGSNVWSEDRLVSATQGVTVTNGLFSIQLGSITTLPASLFASGDLYLEVELPTPASATTSSPVWTEGAMTPRNQLLTSAYAYNSETLDGLDSAAFAQLGGNNTFTGDAVFDGTIQGGSSLTLGTASVAGSLVVSDGSSNTATISVGSLAGNYTYTIPVTTANDTFCMVTLGNCAGGGGVTSVGTYSTTNTNATGATISSGSIIFQDASASAPGMVGTGTQTFAGNKTFSGELKVSKSSSSVQVALLQVEQTGTGDTTLELKNSAGKSFYFGMDQSAGGLLRIGSSTSTLVNNQVGNVVAGGSPATGQDSSIRAKKVTTGPTVSGALSSIAVHLSLVESANPGVKVGLYSHDAVNDRPDALIAGLDVSTTGTVGWNTLPISATISSSTTYWISVNVEGSTTRIDYEYCPACGGRSAYYYPMAFANTWPSSLGAPNSFGADEDWSMYMNVASGSVTDTFAGAKLFAVSDTGVITMQNSMNSASAFQIQNSSGASLFVADTSSSRIQIGSASADTTGAVLVLDTKSDVGDPTGVAGAMYYNSNAGKFRCYQGVAWTDCIGAGGSSTLQGAYTSSTGGTTPEVKVDATRGGVDIQDADTTIGGSLFTVRASNGSGLGASLFDVTSTGVTTFRNSANSSTSFSILNAAGDNLVSVDSTGAGTVSVLANNSGEVGAWQTNANTLPAARNSHTSVIANGYVYSIGGGTAVNYAKLNADGSVGTWQTNANALPAARFNHTSVVANGYVYVIGGGTDIDTNMANTTVYYAKLNADGSTGAWQTAANALPVARGYHSSVVANGYVYAMGGTDNSTTYATVYYAKLNADGTVGAWQTAANALPAIKQYHESVTANGYVYVLGGTGGSAGTTVYYAKLNADGTVGAWQTNANALPLARADHTSVVANGYVYVMGGSSGTTTVYYAKLNTDGTAGAWQTAANGLPAGRSNHSSVIANGYVYVMGGGVNSTVYYARIGGVLNVGGSLDLVGVQGGSLGDANGDSSSGAAGGSITAGNIFGVGTLQINKQALFGDSASVTGDFNAGNGIFSTNIASANVRIGSSVADSVGVVLVLDTKNNAGDPTGVVGGMYYNSSLSKFRCYEGASWRNCSTSAPVNISTTTQAVTAGADTYLAGSVVPILGGLQGPTSGSQNGTMITWKVTMSKTAAGTAASTFTLRAGTNGTTADTARCTNFSTGTATAAADWAEVTITAYATAGGSAATLNCSGTLRHNLATTGFSNAIGVQAYSTAASFDSTPVGTKMGLSFNAGTSSVITIQKVEVSVINL